MKINKKDLLSHILFIITYIIIVLIITHNGEYIMASKTDFPIQHYLIPEYFRNLFYNTKDLFPDFSFHLGGGENIYYLSYYGLFNPIFLISYLLPKISMLDYTIVAMALVVLSSTSLFYFYLRKNKFSHLVSFLSAFLFLCSAPLIFHSHRHIMFISYFPFLLMGFFGIDQLVEKKKSSLLILAVTLMILTSYYFSISGLVVLFILGIWKYVKVNGKQNLLAFIKTLIIRFLIGILISAILIVPTLYTLLNGRTDSINTLHFSDLVKPHMYMLYDNYGIGLTLICLLATIYELIKGKKENKIISLIILIISIFPLFNYVLNGFLYINGKSLIPFLPLVLLNVSDCFMKIFQRKSLKIVITIYSVVTSLIVCLDVNLHKDKLLLKEDIDTNTLQSLQDKMGTDTYRTNTSLIDETYINRVLTMNEYKTTVYSSTFNKNYKEAFNSLFHNPLPYRNNLMLAASNNVLFQMYMGEKYIATKEDLNYLYKNIGKVNQINLYENDYVLPIGYATTNIINDKDFQKMAYPTNIVNMLGKVVTDQKTNTDIKEIPEQPLNYKLVSNQNVEITKLSDGYKLQASKKGRLKLKVDDLTNKLLILTFEVENSSCEEGDLAITINEVKNKLTCQEWKYFNGNNTFHYTLLPSDELNIKIDKGTYKIHHINTYLLDLDDLKLINKQIQAFSINKEKTKGDQILGNISVLEDSYFTLSIPYDKGFTIYVDNNKVDYFKVNQAFIGFKIPKGSHEVKIIYQAPYKKMALGMSGLGLFLYLCIIISERRKKSWKK